MCSSGKGKDRAGTIKRLAAFEMLRQLKLERNYARAVARGDGAGQKRARSAQGLEPFLVECDIVDWSPIDEVRKFFGLES